MVTLVDFPDEVWQVLIALVAHRHFTRLALTGDTRLHARLHAIRCRHFEVPPHFHFSSPLHVPFTVLGARALTLQSYQLGSLATFQQTVFTRLTRLTLRTAGGYTFNSLGYEDFSPFVSLQSLEIDGYLVSPTLVMPRSICTLKVSAFIMVHTHDDEDAHVAAATVLVRDLERLESLTDLTLESSHPHSFHGKYPPHLTSLYVSVGERGLPVHIPDTLVRLEIDAHGPTHSNGMDIYEVVAKRCPRLTSLSIDGDASVSARLPSGLQSLRVSGAIFNHCESESLAETMARLPHTLNDVYFGSLCDGDVPAALSVLLPRLGFESLDGVCRSVLRECPRDAATDACLVAHLMRWMGNDKSKAETYLQFIKTSIDMRRSPVLPSSEPASMGIDELSDAMAAVGENAAEEIARLLLRKRSVFSRSPLVTGQEYSVAVCVRLLEVGAIDWLCGLVSSSTPMLREAARRNLVELRIYARYYRGGALKLFLEANELPALRRIKIGPVVENWTDEFATALYDCRARVPHLELFEVSSPFPRPRRCCTPDTIAKLAEMRLYAKETALNPVTFVYRVHPPLKQ